MLCHHTDTRGCWHCLYPEGTTHYVFFHFYLLTVIISHWTYSHTDTDLPSHLIFTPLSLWFLMSYSTHLSFRPSSYHMTSTLCLHLPFIRAPLHFFPAHFPSISLVRFDSSACLLAFTISIICYTTIFNLFFFFSLSKHWPWKGLQSNVTSALVSSLNSLRGLNSLKRQRAHGFSQTTPACSCLQLGQPGPLLLFTSVMYLSSFSSFICLLFRRTTS